MGQLNNGSKIGDYIVVFHIKDGAYAETYRVKDKLGTLFFLKLIDVSKLSENQFDSKGNLWEIEISKKLNHPNLAKYHDSGSIDINGEQYFYLVNEFISGETVAQRMARVQRFSVYEAKRIVCGILQAVRYIQDFENPIIHNEITVQNVMLEMTDDGITPKIVDFGYARCLGLEHNSFTIGDLNPFYLAPEIYEGNYSQSSDLYSVGVLLYHLLFGLPPYFFDISGMEDVKGALQKARKSPVKVLNKDIWDIDKDITTVLSKALSYNPKDRYQNPDDFLKALGVEDERNSRNMIAYTSATKYTTIKKGGGFADVAGMRELKEQLQNDVIDVLRNPQRAKELGISIPNGLLFFGPPGCGKTFFAEKFAEEIGCNYIYVKCSDVASPYIHGGQEKIAEIFKQAREQAPSIVFLDEIDAMVKDRGQHNNVSEAGEVNEFLAQLNNCGQNNVLVIGATNKPKDIDEAALRSGRLELKYYIPLPDEETRKEEFEIELNRRKVSKDIDYNKLVKLTERYSSADIKLIIDTAARSVFRQKKEEIEMVDLEAAIPKVKPMSVDAVRRHEKIRDEFIGESSGRPKIGFF